MISQPCSEERVSSTSMPLILAYFGSQSKEVYDKQRRKVVGRGGTETIQKLETLKFEVTMGFPDLPQTLGVIACIDDRSRWNGAMTKLD